MPFEVDVRPKGAARRKVRPYAPASWEPAGSGYLDTVRRLFERPDCQLMGRDGTLAQTGAGGGSCINPWTRETVAAGGIVKTIAVIAGVPVTFVHAQGARTNLVATGGTPTGLDAGSGITGLIRSIIEDTSNSAHALTKSGFTVTSGTVYRRKMILRVLSGTRNFFTYLSSGGSWGVWVAPSGVATGVNGTNRTVSNVTSTDLGGGRFLVMADYTQTTGGDLTPGLVLGLSNTTGISPPTYVGDGVSGWAIEADTFSAATFSGLGLAEGVARTADNILWALARPLAATQGEIVALAVPYLWSGAAGTQGPHAYDARLFQANSPFGAEMYRGTVDQMSRSDGGTQIANAASLAVASGEVFMRSAKWDASALTIYRGAAEAAQDTTLSPPWNQPTTMHVATNVVQTRALFGAVAIAAFDTPLTNTQRQALEALRPGLLAVRA